MTSWKKMLSVFGALALVIAMGAGCALDDNSANTNTSANNDPDVNNGMNNADGENDDDFTKEPCPTGTKRFVSSKENITFCHPETVGGENVTIEDAVNSVTIKIGGEVARVLMVENVEKDVNREDKVLEYAANPDDDSIVCEAQSVENEKGRETFILTGKKDGTQGVDAVSACSDSDSLNNALNDEPIGMFFFYDDEEELILVSGGQDAVFGGMTDEFESTIWPKD